MHLFVFVVLKKEVLSMNKKEHLDCNTYIKIHVDVKNFEGKLEVNKLISSDVTFYLCQSLTMVIEAIGNDNDKTLGEKLDMLNHLTEIMQNMLKKYNEVKLSGKNAVETETTFDKEIIK